MRLKSLMCVAILYIIVVSLFLVVKVTQIDYKFSDENIYFYMGRLVSEGSLPYRDFFLASPPVQVFLIAGFIKVFGPNVFVLKLLPIISSVVVSLLLFLMARKFGYRQALLTCMLYLFSFVILTTTDHSTGVHLTSLFLVACIYSVGKGSRKYWPFLSGILAALAVLTRLYASLAVFGLLAYLLVSGKERKHMAMLLSGFLAVFIPVNLVFFLLSGGAYINSVFAYHFLKSEGIAKLNIFLFFLRWDFVLISLTALFLLVRDRKFLLPSLVTVLVFLFYTLYADIYYLYFSMVIPFIALLAARSGMQITTWLKRFNRNLVFLFLISVISANAVYTSYFYLTEQAPMARITFLADLTGFITENSGPEDTIYGSFEITPLVSFLTERRITNNYIDTNDKLFLTGLVKTGERTENIRGKVKFIMTKVYVDPETRIFSTERFVTPEYLEKCKPVRSYQILKDYSSNMLIVWDCENA